MDWETFFGITGVLIMLLGIFVYNFRAHKKLENLYTQLIDVANVNQKLLQVMKISLVEDAVDRQALLAKFIRLEEKEQTERSSEISKNEPKLWGKLIEYTQKSKWFAK
jgi:hypothetical protein